MPTALIVEDEPEANRLLALLVQLRGYRTESAFTGGEALQLVERCSPDIVFLDLMLPDTNGFDVCRALKRDRRTNPIPVVMVTARMAHESRLASFQLGANQFVPKPYTPEQIFEALDHAGAWRRSIEQHEPAGEIRIEASDALRAFAEISRLQSLLLTRTTWGEESVGRFVQDLRTMVLNLLEWGRRNNAEELASLGFELQSRKIVLIVRDLAGWCGSSDLSHDEALGLLLGRRRFDTILYDELGQSATLIKQLPEPEAPPAP